MMSKFPSLSSKQLVKILQKGGAVFVRQGKTDHAIYSRIVGGKRYSAPVQMGKKSLDPVYKKNAGTGENIYSISASIDFFYFKEHTN